MVLQALEGLSDRDAARALTDRISWKVACGLALDEEVFDYSVLTYWRTRLRNSGRPERIFEAVRSVIEDPEGASAIGLLALVAGQDVELDEQGRWRIVRGVAKDRVISVVDPESRRMHKSRSEYRDGYKAHLAVVPETGPITAAALTPASMPNGPTGVELLEGEEPGLQVLADGAYGSGDTLAALGDAGHYRAIKPHPTSGAVPGGVSP